MIPHLLPLVLGLVAAEGAPPAELPTLAFEQRLGLVRPQLRLAAADAPVDAPKSADPFAAPARYGERSATQLHEEGRSMRLLLGAPAALVVMSGTAMVSGVLVLGLAFADSSAGLIFTAAGLGVLGAPAAGAGTVMLIGSFLGGEGGFWAPYLGGMGGAALGLGVLATISSIEGGAPPFGLAFVGVPLLATTGIVLGYEWSSGKRAAEKELRASRSAPGPLLVPVLAPTKDGAIGGLALAF